MNVALNSSWTLSQEDDGHHEDHNIEGSVFMSAFVWTCVRVIRVIRHIVRLWPGTELVDNESRLACTLPCYKILDVYCLVVQ